MTLPLTPNSLSIADINAECGVAVNTTHGLDWVFEITRPAERPYAQSYTPVNVTDQVSGGTIAVANANLGHYRSNPVSRPGQNVGTGWAYYVDNIRTSACDNGNCLNCQTTACGNIGGQNCTTTPINCAVDDTRAWLQGNCNCACSFNCDQVTYTVACNCACPWICACACW